MIICTAIGFIVWYIYHWLEGPDKNPYTKPFYSLWNDATALLTGQTNLVDTEKKTIIDFMFSHVLLLFGPLIVYWLLKLS